MTKQAPIFAAFLCGIFYLSNCSFAAKVVAYNVTRALPENGQTSIASLTRRGPGSVGERLFNNISLGGYFASVQVGTPAQPLMLLLSTGSSDIWVIDQNSTDCNNNNVCVTPFHPNKSQTISTVAAGGFDINYVDGSGATGDYIKDEFVMGQVGQAQLLLQIGLAEKTSTNAGVMGIGYDLNEAGSEYPNFMDVMVSNGITNTKLYSLWLNDLDSSTGSILFGGIDTQKYYGTLYSMPIHPNGTGQYTEFLVDLTSISYTPQAGSTIPLTDSSFSQGAVLESSTTLIYLPDDIVTDIYSQFNVTIASDKAPYVDCKYSNSSYMSFGFESGSVINVPYSDFINKLYVPSPLPSNLSFTDVCSFGIQPAGSNPNLLGDFFLRSAYVVFDLTNNRIGIAQSNLNSTTSNIVEIPAGAASIPQSTGVPSPSPTTSSSSRTSTPTTSNTSEPSPTHISPHKSNHAVAIGVGVAIPVAVILAAILGFFFWRRRKRSLTPPEVAPTTISELGDSSSPVYAKGNGAAALGRVSQMSQNPSELSSESPSTSPRTTRSAFERKPVPTAATPGGELATHWEQSHAAES